MHFGGAPAGPAGTGKTETTKDMGRTLGIYVVVTNCSGEMRYGGRFHADLVYTLRGLPGYSTYLCFSTQIAPRSLRVLPSPVHGDVSVSPLVSNASFNMTSTPHLASIDEFNRIELEVLSVVAQQVLAIQNAQKSNSKSFMFPGETTLVPLDDAFGAFITVRRGVLYGLRVGVSSLSSFVPRLFSDEPWIRWPPGAA